MATEATRVEVAKVTVDISTTLENTFADKGEVDASLSAASAAPVMSKRAAKKSKKTSTPALSTEDLEAESEKNIAASIDHPYLSFLHKRIRLYKKKLEKIKALEHAQVSENKKLNDQQREVVASRGLVEKMITEFESLRGQFIEVFVAEQKEKQQDENKGESVAAATVAVEEVANEVPSPVEPITIAPPTNSVTVVLEADAFEHVKDLLRTLHAVTLHQALGTEVPLVLDYFSKVLLGKTRLPAEVPFDENLTESLEEATRYLTKSDKIVVQEFTYRDLRAMVEQLGVEDKVVVKEEGAAVAEEEENTLVVEGNRLPTSALPEINFFTDSVLEPFSSSTPADEMVVEEGTVTVDVALTIPEPPPVSAVPAPPKSFAAATAREQPVKSSHNNRKQPDGPNPANGEAKTDDKPRRRPSSRPKNSGSSSPRNDKEGKTVDGSKTSGEGSKPRRARPQRQNDENSPPHNVKRTPSTGVKDGERRPRPERHPRKPQDATKA